MTRPAGATISVEGSVKVGIGTLSLPATFGPVDLWESEGSIHFRVTIVENPPSDYMTLVRRMQLAVEAAVAAATGISCTATPDLSTYAIDGRPALNIGVTAFAYVTVTAGPDASARGRQAAEAVLLGADERLAELWEVYLLGVRAVALVAPAVGLWAFATVLEEDRPPKVSQLDHVPQLADELRAEGRVLPPMTGRNPTRVRNAALHPTPKDPLPTHEEVVWLQLVAGAYLTRRGRQGRAVRSVMRVLD